MRYFHETKIAIKEFSKDVFLPIKNISMLG